ncbi:hypothetical protein BKH46_06635 [Helicobacter sp. 12S02634-8]|uniref:hypothetical protein n=1 Tax=Helicobacter sp. 12S02634-8 TaxID=1476199 RepID=UPI000BA5A40B|nr:hypothetical protein [Helicobacter sp. 12S02634-8]PAF46640.1 hypothetical protein BKH46_06635 [Helicobacter sp. 12S02634-8]
MLQSVTLYVKDNKELRITKNLLIISILVYALLVGVSLFLPQGGIVSLLHWGLVGAFFASNIAGFYRLSKLAQSQILFKNYMLSIVGLAIFLVVVHLAFKLFLGTWIFEMSVADLQTLLGDTSAHMLFFALVFVGGMVYFGLSIYWGYKICSILSALSGDRIFSNGFNFFAGSVVLMLIANVVFAFMGQLGSFLSLISLLGMLMGGLMMVSGFFRLKQITYLIAR